MYQGEVDLMIRHLNDHTCISLSMELNHHLTTPFPRMNKTVPKSLSNIDDTQLLSKIGINKDHDILPDTLPSSSEADVMAVQPTHNDVTRTSGDIRAAQLLDALHKAVMKRVTLIPDDHVVWQELHEISHGAAYNQGANLSGARVAILFSGGVDSMVLAALTDRQGVMLVFHW